MCLGLDARTALWYTIAADSVWPPGNWTPAPQRGLTGGLRKQQMICAIRVAGWPARAGGLLLLQRRYPGDGRTGIYVLFMHFIQELYSILSLVLAGNGE